MPKYLPVFDNTEVIEKEKKQEESTIDPKALKAAGFGALNQWNLFSNITGATNTLIGNKLDKSISDDDWKKKSILEKYQANKDIIQKKVNELEDEYPKASLTGNIAGAIVPAILTGGGSLTGTGAQLGSKLAPKAAAKIASKISPDKLKLAGQVADSSLIAGADTAMFERDPEKRGEAFLKGAGLGAAFPLAIKGAKAAVTKGDPAKKYIERIPEVLEQKKQGRLPVTELQEKVIEKVKTVEPELNKESRSIAKNLKEQFNSSNLDVQNKEVDLLDQLSEAKSQLQGTISKESSGGYELLKETKGLPTQKIEDVIKETISKTDMKADPSAVILNKYKDRIASNKGKIDGVELKNLINAMRADYDSYISTIQKGEFIPKGYKAIKKAADAGDNLLKEANPDYKAYMVPLADKTSKSINISKVLKLNKNSPENTLKVLKNYKNSIKTQKALDDLKEQTGIDIRPFIDDVVDSNVTVKAVDKNEDDLVKAIVSSTDSNEYQSFLNAAQRYKDKTGVDILPEVQNLRLKYQVDLLNRAKKLTTEKGEGGLTAFQKNVRNLNTEDYDPKNVFQRIAGDEVPSDIKITQAKSNKARRDIADLSNFLGEDVGKNTKDIEAASLYDYMGSGKTNGSRNVNLGTILGYTGSSLAGAGAGAIGGSLGGPVGTAIGAGIGALAGGLKDTGVIQRIRREILNSMYNPANARRNDIINKVGRFEAATTLPSEIQKEKNRDESTLQSFEAWRQLSTPINTTQSIENKKEQNQEYFGRSGS